MDQYLVERVQPDECIRGYFLNAIVWDIFVGSANIYRPTSQIKNAAQFDNFGRVIE